MLSVPAAMTFMVCGDVRRRFMTSQNIPLTRLALLIVHVLLHKGGGEWRGVEGSERGGGVRA